MELSLSERIELAHIRFFLRSPMSLAGLLVIPALCAVVLWPFLPHPLILSWLMGMYVVVFIRRLTWNQLRNVTLTEDITVMRRYLRRALTAIFLVGVAWGFFGLSLALLHDIRAESFVIVVMLGIVAGATLVTAAWLPAAIIIISPMLTPLLIILLLRLDWYFATVAVGITIYAILVISFVLNYNRWLEDFIKLQINNAQLVNELVTARDTATAASAAKSTFLANISHELRTPLNSILGFSEIIRDGLIKDMGEKTIKEYAHYIYDSGAYLLQLINNVLDFSKIEAGRTELSFSPFSVSSTIGTCITLMQQMASQQGVLVVNDLPPSGVMMEGDELRVRQIFINLLSNAIKFTPQGGRVTVSLTTEKQEWVNIVVRDTGLGMSPEELRVALEPFGQVTSVQRSGLNGTGLGLPLTKALAELHGGTLTVESTKNHGTTVHVRLPLKRQSKTS